ncbi:MAG TPA: Maf family protein [Nocardioidaceae bacterium]|nr:Maf family protein [Nocardioidaceae bacterium]
MSLVLASASPARLTTLRGAGIEPRVIVSGVDESVVPSDGTLDPAEFACRLAALKAEAVSDRLERDGDRARFVLGCDSVLELDGRIFGKPADADDARARWGTMSGRSGVLHTGHCLRDRDHDKTLVRGAATVVHFAEVTEPEITAYVATGEPLEVAGAFTIDGLGGAFVRGVEGDPHTVVGLSLPVLREMFAELGLTWTDLWGAMSR